MERRGFAPFSIWLLITSMSTSCLMVGRKRRLVESIHEGCFAKFCFTYGSFLKDLWLFYYTPHGVFLYFFEPKINMGYFVFWLWVEVVDKIWYIFL